MIAASLDEATKPINLEKTSQHLYFYSNQLISSHRIASHIVAEKFFFLVTTKKKFAGNLRDFTGFCFCKYLIAIRKKDVNIDLSIGYAYLKEFFLVLNFGLMGRIEST